MLYLFGCLVSSIAFGIGLVCKIVDMVHSTNTDKLKDYKLILLISKLLNDFKNYKVNIKFKEDNLIDDFNEITIKDLVKKEDGIKNLIIYFQKLEYNEQLLYFSTLDVTRFNNSNLISMKILPKLYSILFDFYDNKVNNKDF